MGRDWGGEGGYAHPKPGFPAFFWRRNATNLGFAFFCCCFSVVGVALIQSVWQLPSMGEATRTDFPCIEKEIIGTTRCTHYTHEPNHLRASLHKHCSDGHVEDGERGGGGGARGGEIARGWGPHHLGGLATSLGWIRTLAERHHSRPIPTRKNKNKKTKKRKKERSLKGH